MDGGWKEKENDDTMEAVLSEADGGCKVAGAGGKRTGESAIGSADCEVAGGGESEPDKTGGEGGDERAKDFGDGERAAQSDDWHVDPGGACVGQQGRNQIGAEERDETGTAAQWPGESQNPQPLTEGCGARLGLSSVIGACLLRTAPS